MSRKLNIFSLDSPEGFKGSCVLAIGIFDGVHRGHVKVLQKAREIALKKSRPGCPAKVCAVTFSPHPAKVLGKTEKASELLYNPDTRAAMLLESGADYVFVKKFDLEFAALKPEDFVLYLRMKFPGLLGIVTGENFHFGANGAGTQKWLQSHEALTGVECIGVRGVKYKGRFVSSSRMRSALHQGKLGEFRAMSGYDYFAFGKVCAGRKLGRKIGFPTLNLHWEPECRPLFGVYAVRLLNLKSGKSYDGIANYGVNPTVGKTSPAVEANLFENVKFGEGTPVKISFLKFFRREKNFHNLERLIRQIKKDKESAKRYFGL